MDGWFHDLKYATRSILAARKFAVIVIVTLALGIGANTAVFGVLNAVVLRPLPYEAPDQLVRVYQSQRGEDSYLPRPAVLHLREHSRTVDVAALYTYSPESADLTDRARPERVRTLQVSASYFDVLRVKPMLGQMFAAADERKDARVALVSARLWREHLAGEPAAVGRMLSLNGIAYHVAAVLPDDFADPLQPEIDVWLPIDLSPNDNWFNDYLTVVARVRPGATIDQARAELGAMALGLAWNGPATKDRKTVRVAALQDDTIGSAGPMLWLLLGAVGLLLLIACVNVASLFLARGAARQSELAIRAALGSSRWRMIRQLLVESLLLSFAGGLAGLLLARIVTRALLAVGPEEVTRMKALSAGAAHGVGATHGASVTMTTGGSGISGVLWSFVSSVLPGFGASHATGDVALQGTVFAFGFVVALLAGIGFGVGPALQFTRPNLEGMLRESGRGGVGSRRQTRARNLLVVCQMALALVLLIGTGLLLRTVDRLRAVPLGAEPANVLTFEVHLPAGRYADPGQRARFHRDLEARIAALPGVRATGAISRLPATGTYHSWQTTRPDLGESSPRAQPDNRVIEGDYFKALRIPLLRGRTFAESDESASDARNAGVATNSAATMPAAATVGVPRSAVTLANPAAGIAVAPRLASPPSTTRGTSTTAGTPPTTAGAPRVVVISRELARQLFGDEDPIERTVRVVGETVRVIGVVGDVAIGARAPVRPMLYHWHRQFAADRNWSLTQLVALDRPTPGSLDQVRRELAAIDPALVLYRPRALSDVVAGGIAQERFALLLIAAFAGLALVLAAVGIYGVLSYAVTRRTREMGIRLALGAPRHVVWSLILRDGGRLTAAGIAVGLVAAYAATRALRSLLFNVEPTDPIVYLTAAVTLAVVALAATWIPARTATRVDPLHAVRSDT